MNVVETMRIFIGTTEISGMYRALARTLRDLGHEVHFVTYETNPFGYGSEDTGWLIGCIRRLRGSLNADASRGRHRAWRRVVARPLLRLCEAMLFLWAAWRCDAFIFAFHQSILPKLRDLRMLRWLGRTVWMQSNGSDVRPPFIDATVTRRASPVSDPEIERVTRRCHDRIRTAERWATGSIDIPMQGLQRSHRFINWLKVGVIATPDWFPETYSPPTSSDSVRILHCPSFPAGKGSVELRAIVERLAEELAIHGIAIDYIEIVGRPNAEVLQALLSTDIVVDQLYADYGMAGLAVEAAWFGRPVVVGGYAADLWRSLLAPHELPPTHYVHPDEVAAELRRLIVDPIYRTASGRRHRSFMETTWAPRAVAERYVRLLRDDIPDDWWVTVDDALSPHGWGLPERVLRETVSTYVASCGKSALCLDHVPDRRDRLLGHWLSNDTRLAHAVMSNHMR